MDPIRRRDSGAKRSGSGCEYHRRDEARSGLPGRETKGYSHGDEGDRPGSDRSGVRHCAARLGNAFAAEIPRATIDRSQRGHAPVSRRALWRDCCYALVWNGVRNCGWNCFRSFAFQRSEHGSGGLDWCGVHDGARRRDAKATRTIESSRRSATSAACGCCPSSLGASDNERLQRSRRSLRSRGGRRDRGQSRLLQFQSRPCPPLVSTLHHGIDLPNSFRRRSDDRENKTGCLVLCLHRSGNRAHAAFLFSQTLRPNDVNGNAQDCGNGRPGLTDYDAAATRRRAKDHGCCARH